MDCGGFFACYLSLEAAATQRPILSGLALLIFGFIAPQLPAIYVRLRGTQLTKAKRQLNYAQNLRFRLVSVDPTIHLMGRVFLALSTTIACVTICILITIRAEELGSYAIYHKLFAIFMVGVGIGWQTISVMRDFDHLERTDIAKKPEGILGEYVELLEPSDYQSLLDLYDDWESRIDMRKKMRPMPGDNAPRA